MRVEAPPVLSGTLADWVLLPVGLEEREAVRERVAELTVVPLELAEAVTEAEVAEAAEVTEPEELAAELAEAEAEAEAEREAAEEEAEPVPPETANWPEKLLSSPWTISKA